MKFRLLAALTVAAFTASGMVATADAATKAKSKTHHVVRHHAAARSNVTPVSQRVPAGSESSSERARVDQLNSQSLQSARTGATAQ